MFVSNSALPVSVSQTDATKESVGVYNATFIDQEERSQAAPPPPPDHGVVLICFH